MVSLRKFNEGFVLKKLNNIETNFFYIINEYTTKGTKSFTQVFDYYIMKSSRNRNDNTVREE